MKINKIDISDISLYYDCIANKQYLEGKKQSLKKSIILLLLNLLNKITFFIQFIYKSLIRCI